MPARAKKTGINGAWVSSGLILLRGRFRKVSFRQHAELGSSEVRVQCPQAPPIILLKWGVAVRSVTYRTGSESDLDFGRQITDKWVRLPYAPPIKCVRDASGRHLRLRTEVLRVRIPSGAPVKLLKHSVKFSEGL